MANSSDRLWKAVLALMAVIASAVLDSLSNKPDHDE